MKELTEADIQKSYDQIKDWRDEDPPAVKAFNQETLRRKLAGEPVEFLRRLKAEGLEWMVCL